jgi:hypothetical protein
MVAALLRMTRSLKRTVKRNPRLWNIAYTTREKLGRLRR